LGNYWGQPTFGDQEFIVWNERKDTIYKFEICLIKIRNAMNLESSPARARFKLRNTKLKPPLKGRKTETDRQVEEVADTGKRGQCGQNNSYLIANDTNDVQDSKHCKVLQVD